MQHAVSLFLLVSSLALAIDPAAEYRINVRWPSVTVATKDETLDLSCRTDGAFSTGERLKCGTQRPYVELLRTYDENGGAAVLQYVHEGEKQKKFFTCDWKRGRCEEKRVVESVEEGTLVSPIRSSTKVLTMANSHVVVPGVFRSMAPKSDEDYASIEAAKIGEVIIFKDEVKGDVTREEKRLEAMKKKVHRIPFLWKDHPNFREPCEQVVSALKILLTERESPILFHCTVGEDRTGLLAGLYRYLTKGGSASRHFQDEMCERGYALGDAKKPYTKVVTKIYESLTRLFVGMLYKIDQKELTIDKLDPAVCAQSPFDDKAFLANAAYDPNRYKCRSSSRFRP